MEPKEIMKRGSKQQAEENRLLASCREMQKETGLRVRVEFRETLCPATVVEYGQNQEDKGGAAEETCLARGLADKAMCDMGVAIDVRESIGRKVAQPHARGRKSIEHFEPYPHPP